MGQCGQTHTHWYFFAFRNPLKSTAQAPIWVSRRSNITRQPMKLESFLKPLENMERLIYFDFRDVLSLSNVLGMTHVGQVKGFLMMHWGLVNTFQGQFLSSFFLKLTRRKSTSLEHSNGFLAFVVSELSPK